MNHGWRGGGIGVRANRAVVRLALLGDSEPKLLGARSSFGGIMRGDERAESVDERILLQLALESAQRMLHRSQQRADGGSGSSGLRDGDAAANDGKPNIRKQSEEYGKSGAVPHRQASSMGAGGERATPCSAQAVRSFERPAAAVGATSEPMVSESQRSG